MYAHGGSSIHKVLEEYYNGATADIDKLKELFNQQWTSHKLDETKLKLKKDIYWLMILNGVQLNIPVTTTELKIYFNDALGYIDAVDTNNDIIRDWKSSTRSKINEVEYTEQLKYYSWLYYRKFERLPKKAVVHYLKYSGKKGELSIIPTMDDIKWAEEWNAKTRERMDFYIANPNKLPLFNRKYFFCPYKHLWGGEHEQQKSINFNVHVYGSYIKLEGDITALLETQLLKKFSYELKNSFWIKKHNPAMNTTINFWNSRSKHIPIGFYHGFLKTLNDYIEFMKKKKGINGTLNIVEHREFCDKKIGLPDKLQSGIILRDYQELAIESFLNDKIGTLELATGAGKTEVAIEVIRTLDYKTIFFVDKIELLNQTITRMENNLGIKVGKIGQGEKEFKDISVATIQTVIKILSPTTRLTSFKNNIKRSFANKIMRKELGEKVDTIDKETKEVYLEECIRTYQFTTEDLNLIKEKEKEIVKDYNYMVEYLRDIRVAVFDEAHKTAMKSFITVSKYLTGSEYRLGITATAYRDDGNDMGIASVCGNIINSVTAADLIEQGHLCKPEVYFIKDYLEKDIVKQLEDECKTGLINETANYPKYYDRFIVNGTERNNIIRKVAERFKNDKVLIVVKLIEHGEFLKTVIPNSEYLHGSTPKKEREQIFNDFKTGSLNILISTISIFAEGIDIPQLKVVINASANAGSVKTVQVLGRSIRNAEGKSKAIFIDFFDVPRFFTLSSLARKRALIKEKHYIKNITFQEFMEDDSI